MRAKRRLEAVAALAALAAAAFGGSPQPCAVLCGLLRDAYGFPYTANAEIRVLRGTVVCDRYAIRGLLGGGLNYRLELDVDSGGALYAPYAVHAGDAVIVSVPAGGTEQPLIPGGAVTVGKPGSLTRLDLCTGTDADGDGLPDEWEQQLVDQSGGRLTNIVQVLPNDDFDGDGMSNAEELQACTFPFLATDLLEVRDLKQVAPGRFRLRFLSSANMTYRLVARERLDGGAWYPLPFAPDAQAPASYRELVGDGSYRTVYVDVAGPVLFVRLAAH